jgi:hypothetical protein
VANVNTKQEYTKWINQNVRIGALLAERDIYENYPRWQRNSAIWPKHRQRRFIRTLLAGRYVPNVVMFPSTDHNDPRLWCLDGRQRFSTLFRFIDGSLSLNEHSGFYQDLSDVEQKKLKGYSLGLAILQETNEDILRATYRDLQNLSTLSAAERLFSYVEDTPITRLAVEIVQHPYFVEQFTGSTKRKEDYQMGLYPLSIELNELLANMDVLQLERLSKKDIPLPDNLQDTIDANLYAIQHLFKSVRTQARTALIAMYQAVYLLNLAGYNLEKSQEDCLTPWFETIRKITDERGKGNLLHMYQRKFQHIFWQQELRVIAATPGLVCGPENCSAQIDRLCSWIHNLATCPQCEKYVHIDQIEVHGFRLTDRCQRTSQLALAV